MDVRRFFATGISFGIHEWRGSGPPTLHVHHLDDEAWHLLDGQERRCLCQRASLTRTRLGRMRAI